GEILSGAGGGSSRRRNGRKLGQSHQGKGEEPPHWTDSMFKSAMGCASYGKMWPQVKFSAYMTVHCRAVAPLRSPNALKKPRRSPLSGASQPATSMSHDSSTTLGRPGFAIPRLSLPAGLLISLGLIAIAAGIEHAMGRLFFCKCGTFKLWYGGRGGLGGCPPFARWDSYSPLGPRIFFFFGWSVAGRGWGSGSARGGLRPRPG